MGTTVEVAVASPEDPGARACLAAYYRELDARFSGGFDPTAGAPAPPGEMRPPAGLFLVATMDGRPVGCGGLRFYDEGWAEVKRLWVRRGSRGCGIGRRLLAELEARAAAHGSRAVRLDTNRSLEEAIALYRACGYHEISAFNANPYAHHWFEKSLPSAAPGL